MAVFLALGIGIAIGSLLESQGQTVVTQQQDVIHDLQDRLSAALARAQSAEAATAAQDAARREALALADRLWKDAAAGLLSGRTVAIVNVGAPAAQGEALAAIRAAGARPGPIVTIDPAVVSGQDEALARLGEATGRSLPLESYVRAWAAELLAGGEEPATPSSEAAPEGTPALDAAVRAGAVSLAWDRPADGTGDAVPPDSVVVLLASPVSADAWQAVVVPWLDAARMAGRRAAVATFAAAEPDMGDIFRRTKAPTVANLGSGAGELALVRVLAGADGHFGEDADDDGWWPPDPRANPALGAAAGSGPADAGMGR